MEKHPDLEEILREIKTELRESFLIDFYKKNFRNFDINKIEIEPKGQIILNAAVLEQLISQIAPEKALKIYEEGIDSENISIQIGTATTLKTLVKYITPKKALELYEIGINQNDDRIKAKVSEALENLIPLIDSKKAIELYENGINYNGDYHIINNISKSLVKLIPLIDSKKAIELYEIGMGHSDKIVCTNISKSYETLIPLISPDKAIELYEKGINNPYNGVKYNLLESFKTLIPYISLDKAVELYLKGINNSEDKSKTIISESLETLIQHINKDKNKELYLNLIGENDYIVNNYNLETGIKKTLEFNSEEAIESYLQGINNKNDKIKTKTLKLLPQLIPLISPDKAIELYEIGINHRNPIVNYIVSESLKELIPRITPKKAEELYLNGINHRNPKVRANISNSFGSLLSVISSKQAIKIYKMDIELNPRITEITKYFGDLIENLDIKTTLELYNYGVNNPLIRNRINRFSNIVFSKISQYSDTFLKDYPQFIENYLSSKYVKTEDDFRTKEQIISELKTLVQNPNRNYLNMSHIVKAGKATNLEEIIECSEFESTEGELFLSRLGDGGVAGVTYLVNSPSLGEIAVKVLKKGKYNPKEVEVLNKLAGDEEKLENIVRFIHAPDNQISRNGENVETIFMEFIDGENLETIYNQNSKGLEESIALNYSRQLLKGILDLRRKEIFHRDIHLGNVMIDNLGKLKIVDFGIAEDNLNAEPESNLRHGGVTDLVSWAFITYELFTGEHLLYNRQTVVDNKTNIRDEIRKRRDEMLDENGGLKQEYLRKIHENIPRSLFLPVTFALSHSDMEPISNVLKDYFFGFLYKFYKTKI